MTIDELRAKGLIILECISGSKAYGLDTPQSDTDIKGVFVLPKKDFYGLNYIKQVNNETNDIVFNAILPAFQIAGIEFVKVPIGFFEGSIYRQKMSVLGGNTLKRFHIIFDLKNSHIYLRPNRLWDIPYSNN